ncbi:MAG: phosphoglycerate/bisphosphoglycerate mutase [Sphingomonadales bacterium]|jgi:alpha-ribazole phosphatase|nr:phosphoglycerate/bisphosphoglycerate mutase [Sphingomonadales bacterium]
MTGYLLHLLRHGAPETPGLMMGRTDGLPTEAGIMACVENVQNVEIKVLISSNLVRARAPAEVVAGRIANRLVIDPRWRELDFGDWDGKASSEVDPDALGRFWDDPDHNPPPGGERWSALTNRVGAAIASLSPRPTLVVTHGGAMRAALAVLCGFDQRQVWAFDLPYASLLTLHVWPGEQASAQIMGLSQ